MILYFSATGNCLDIARKLDANILSIPQELKKEGNLHYEDEMIGIVVPDYASELPQIVRRFLKRATFQTNYLYAIVTYGKEDAVVAEWTKQFGEENNVHFNYVNTLLMVDNYLPSFDMNEEMSLDKHIPEQLETIRNDILNKKEYIKEGNEEKQKLHDLVAQRNLDDPSINNGNKITVKLERCVGCGICSKVCPISNFYVENGKAQRQTNTCEFCLACAHACPQKAIYCKDRDKNEDARFRNPNVSLADIISSNQQ